MLVLGLETSCDETSVAILNNNSIVANAIYTQQIHAQYGGVVPEIASREHIKKIDRLCNAILKEQGLSIEQIDLIAVTDRPGLAGALLVGIAFAIGLHLGYSKPIIGVNHLEGHIASATLQNQELTMPFLSLVVSGGHTAIYQVMEFGVYECLGQTIDDAAGEAFDKVGKLLGFPYPAGRHIETFASTHASSECIDFPVAKVLSPGINFSFSGLKTAVKYYCAKQTSEWIEKNKPLICYSFQKAVIDSIITNMRLASEKTGIKRIALVGGVACNNSLRNALKNTFGSDVFFPSPQLCTDNAAMIAKAGYEHFIRNKQRFPRMQPSGALI